MLFWSFSFLEAILRQKLKNDYLKKLFIFFCYLFSDGK